MDESSKGKRGPAGIGGVLRYSQGLVKAMFASSVRIRDSNEAVFMAIIFALEMSIKKDWLKNMEIIIETDSKNAWSWINNREDYP